MYFKLKKNLIIFHYSIFYTKIEHIPDFKDLGRVFDFKLNLTLYIEMIKNKAMRNLGFIKRICRPFTDTNPLKIFYCSLFRFNLEYCHRI
jgi:hypothetical protein